ncbi:hypothetical protein LUZ60_017333 [Juncus effusus]|nr:hypothetical protein LUZ60_017333 [Juncus effusus]
MSKIRDHNNVLISYKHVPKGHVPVIVGSENQTERFVVQIEMLSHPSVMHLLEMAAQEFGYEQKGILRLPCDVTSFRQILNTVK